MLNHVALQCDGQNVHFNSENQVIALDLFVQKNFGAVTYKKVYAGVNQLKKWSDIWNKKGYECCSVIASKDYPNFADNKLKDDCRKYILPDCNILTVILLSKDRDFVPLVRELKAAGKKVILITNSKENTSRDLLKEVDEVYTLSETETGFSPLNVNVAA